jgi:hypothetical protein
MLREHARAPVAVTVRQGDKSVVMRIETNKFVLVVIAGAEAAFAFNGAIVLCVAAAAGSDAMRFREANSTH